MKDMIGNPLSVGDRVAWGAGGRHGWGTRHGVVTELHPSPADKRYARDEVRVKAVDRGAGGLRRADAVVRIIVPEVAVEG